MNLPIISFSRPSFSPRFFIYFLFGLVILILAVEGGYYFWTQKRIEKQKTKNPLIVREEGVFTYIKSTDGSVQKMILGTIRKIDGDLLTIKTDNNKTVQVFFIGERVRIADFTFGTETGRLKNGTIGDLLIGDEVRIADISSEDKGQITAKYLAIVRGVGE